MKRLTIAAGFCCGTAALTLLAAGAVNDRWFEDVTQKAGVSRKHTNRVFDNPYAKIMAGYTALGAAAFVTSLNLPFPRFSNN